ncbi:MAG: hypothetical protein HQL20_11155 [Candidatus Omnitrophica bacterium]|nr:hypothetical protein [Candidatus Omnitrophota bacterium]
MEQLLLWGVGLWVLTRLNKKKGAPSAQSVAPGSVDFETGRVKVLPWPDQTPTKISEIDYPLFYVGPGGRTIGPATACTLPNKLQLRQDMISAIQQLQVLASQWQQLSPAMQQDVQGDRIREAVEEQTNKLNKAYRDLKNGCLNVRTQTFSPDTTATLTRVAP